MSQAEALLKGLSEPTTYSTNSDAVIVIGDDRFITVPDSLKRIAVQYDHNIETVSFDCPRFWDGHDMSQMNVYINYLLPNGKTGQYLAQNVSARGQRMSFDWTISNNVTQYRGNLSFLICVKRSDDSGNEERHWNSELNRELYISEGLECTPAIITRYPDIITQLLTRMDEVEELATPEAMQAYADTWLEENHERLLEEINNKAEEVLASIPEEYSSTVKMAEEGARDKANAIEQTVTGEAITIDDSADTYLLGLKLYGKTTQVVTTGKQLADFTGGNTASGVTKQFSNDALIVDGNGSLPYQSWSVSIKNVIDAHPGEVLHFDFESITTKNSPDGTIVQLNISKSDGTKEHIALYNKIGARNSYSIPSDTSVVSSISLAVYTSNHATASANTVTIVRPMLQIGTDKLSYEPYTAEFASPSLDWPQALNSIGDDNPITTTTYGKNLLQPREFSAYGYNVAVNDDGSITVTGAVDTEQAIYLMITPYSDVYPLKLHNGVDYYMWYESSNGKSIGTKSLDSNDNPVLSNIETWNTNVLHRCDRIIQVYIESKNHEIGDTSLCGTYRFQLEVGDDFTGFEGYKERQELRSAHKLHGIPVPSGGNYTDESGQQWICDEIDFERGVYVQRVGSVTFADATWIQNSSGKYLCNEYRGMFSNEYSVMCTHMRGGSASDGGDENAVFINANRDIRLNITLDDPSVENVAYVMRDAELCGVLVTPIETPLTAEELENFKMVRSNYPNTTILNDSGAHMVVKYAADTKKYVDDIVDAETDKQHRSNHLTDGAKVATRAMVSFMDDDCKSEVYNILRPVIQKNNIPYTLACPTGHIDDAGYMTVEQLKGMYELGVTIAGHTKTESAMTDFTPDELDAVLSECENDFRRWGIDDVMSYAYCNGIYADDDMGVVKKHFQMGFTVEPGINQIPYESYYMKRVGVFANTASIGVSFTTIENQYINANGKTAQTTGNRVRCEPIAVTAGEEYFVTCSAIYGGACYVFWDANRNPVSGGIKCSPNDENGVLLKDHRIRVPDGATSLLIAHNLDKYPDETMTIKKVAHKYTLANAKEYVDQLASEGGWLVFMTHSWYRGFSADDLVNLVNYIRGKGIDIVNVNQAIELTGNVVDIGQFQKPIERTPNPYFVMDALGRAWTNSLTDTRTPGETNIELAFDTSKVISSSTGLSISLSSSDPAYVVSKPIDVTDCDKVLVTGWAYGGYGLYSFLNASGAYVDGAKSTTAWAAGGDALDHVEIAIPSGAAKIIIAGNRYEKRPALTKINSIKQIKTVGRDIWSAINELYVMLRVQDGSALTETISLGTTDDTWISRDTGKVIGQQGGYKGVRMTSYGHIVKPGETYLVTCSATYGKGLYTIMGADRKTVISYRAGHDVNNDAVLNDYLVTIPEGAYQLILAADLSISGVTGVGIKKVVSV